MAAPSSTFSSVRLLGIYLQPPATLYRQAPAGRVTSSWLHSHLHLSWPHPPAHHHLRNPPGWGHRQWCSYEDQQTAPSPCPRQVILLMGSRAPNHGENGKKGFLHSQIRSLCVLPLDEAKTLRDSGSCSQAGAQTHQSRLFLHFCSKTQQRPLILRIPKASWLTVYFKRIPESTHFKAYDLSSLRLRTGFTVC